VWTLGKACLSVHGFRFHALKLALLRVYKRCSLPPSNDTLKNFISFWDGGSGCPGGGMLTGHYTHD
jgi:hypothetical protein